MPNTYGKAARESMSGIPVCANFDHREFDIDLSTKYYAIMGNFIQQPAMFRPGKPWSKWIPELKVIKPTLKECANYDAIEVSEISPSSNTVVLKKRRRLRGSH